MIKLEKNGIERRLSTGYSFKSLVFGIFFPLFIGDLTGAFRHFLLAVCTCGISWLFVPFFYNKKKIKRFVEKGYLPATIKDKQYLVRKIHYKSIK